MRSVRGVAVMLLAVSFAVGAGAGMAAEEALGLDWFDFLDTDLAPPEAQLLEGLNLTAGQQASMDSIVDGQERALEGYWARRVPEIDSLLAMGYAEMRSRLDPAQQAEFDRRIERLDRQVPREYRD